MLKKILTGLSMTSLLFVNACSSEEPVLNQNILPQTTNIQSVSNEQNATDVNAPEIRVFVSNVAKLGVNLSPEQLRIISQQRHLTPSGNFASRPLENLTAEQNLSVHFNKHRKEFKNINNKEQYLQSAVDFHNRKSPSITYYFDTTSFAKKYQSNVIKFDAKTHELSAMRLGGDITTYYTSDTPSLKRFVPVPEDFYFN